MMIWGGLLYLRNWEVRTVRRLCVSRDRMMRELGDWVEPRRFRYLPLKNGGRSKMLVHGALYLYWLLGGCSRSLPCRQGEFDEQAFLRPEQFDQSLTYEEACVAPSDARFVLSWLLAHRGPRQIALNHCALESGAHDRGNGRWTLEIKDALTNREHRARARWVVNAAGVWTDAVNQRFGIETPCKHLLSKGAWIGIARHPKHHDPLLFDAAASGDNMSLIPWGPIALWGPTETIVEAPDRGFAIRPADIRHLLGALNRHLRQPLTPADVISLRCGVRPLAVDRSYRHTGHALDLSRRHRICRDHDRPWISVFGGKLTNCVGLANEVARLISAVCPPTRVSPTRVSPPGGGGNGKSPPNNPEWAMYPTLAERFPSARWCAEHEMCWRLEDYLRRRTNIAQWVPRGGLGAQGEHRAHLTEIARAFSRNGDDSAREQVTAYERKMQACFDDVLAAC
jgi:glycerol-3-phosphate dehydrogenase